MNNNLLNGLQLYRGKRFSDLVDENMISNALLTNPHQVSGLLSLVFGTKDDGVSTAIDGDHAVNIMWAKCDGVDVNENTAAGLNGTPIYIALEEKWYGWHKC